MKPRRYCNTHMRWHAEGVYDFETNPCVYEPLPPEKVRVLRVIEYVGDREWVEATVAKSLHGTKHVISIPGGTIRAATIGEYPEVLDRDEDDSHWKARDTTSPSKKQP